MGEQMDANLERAREALEPVFPIKGQTDVRWKCKRCQTVHDELYKAEACQCEPVKASAPGGVIPIDCDPSQVMPQPSASERQVGGDHYKRMKVQVWDIVDGWPLAERIAYYRGNALKYLMRLGDKDTPEMNARKAEHYCAKLAETLERAAEEGK